MFKLDSLADIVQHMQAGDRIVILRPDDKTPTIKVSYKTETAAKDQRLSLLEINIAKNPDFPILYAINRCHNMITQLTDRKKVHHEQRT